MTTPARREEASAASATFQAALTTIGAKTVADALVLWQDIPPAGRASAVAPWLASATRLILGRRRHSRELARAYYRLTRALLTGTTVADPYHPEPSVINLHVLRRQFAQLANPNDPQAGSDAAGGDEPIEVEELDGLRESEEQIERQAEQETKVALDALGPKNLDRKLKDIDGEAPASEVDGQRADAHRKAGARQAAAASRLVQNGARSTVWNHAAKDKKAIGYVRVSTTGSPCGWCAMLISRGPVYKSEKSATRAFDDGDLYHDNCNCIAVPVFSLDQYESDPRFRLNREYAKQWPRVTEGLSGKAAVSAWRNYIRRQQASSAQAA